MQPDCHGVQAPCSAPGSCRMVWYLYHYVLSYSYSFIYFPTGDGQASGLCTAPPRSAETVSSFPPNIVFYVACAFFVIIWSLEVCVKEILDITLLYLTEKKGKRILEIRLYRMRYNIADNYTGMIFCAFRSREKGYAAFRRKSYTG